MTHFNLQSWARESSGSHYNDLRELSHRKCSGGSRKSEHSERHIFSPELQGQDLEQLYKEKHLEVHLISSPSLICIAIDTLKFHVRLGKKMQNDANRSLRGSWVCALAKLTKLDSLTETRKLEQICEKRSFSTSVKRRTGAPVQLGCTPLGISPCQASLHHVLN